MTSLSSPPSNGWNILCTGICAVYCTQKKRKKNRNLLLKQLNRMHSTWKIVLFPKIMFVLIKNKYLLWICFHIHNELFVARIWGWFSALDRETEVGKKEIRRSIRLRYLSFLTNCLQFRVFWKRTVALLFSKSSKLMFFHLFVFCGRKERLDPFYATMR